jgi:hypothetical protein
MFIDTNYSSSTSKINNKIYAAGSKNPGSTWENMILALLLFFFLIRKATLIMR